MLFSKRDLYKLILPLVVEQLLAITIGMADTVMVASLGEAAVSGVALVDTINVLIINVFSALATGGAVVAAQYVGAAKEEKACVAAKQLVLVTVFLSVFIMVMGVVFNEHILHSIFGDTEEAVMKNAEVYFFISALSYPFIALYNAGAAVFRAMGNSKISMFTSLFMNGMNIIGNYILIFIIPLGVAGAAISTLASRIFGAVIVLFLLKNRNNIVHIKRLFSFDVRPFMIKKILRIGIPNGFENGSFQIGKILVQSIVASYGTYAIAANAVGNNIAMVSLIPGLAIGLAMVTVVGQCIGAGESEQAVYYTKLLTKLSYVSVGSFNILLLLFLKPLIGLYGFEEITNEMAMGILRFNCICTLLLWPPAFTLPNGLRAAGDVKYTMIVSVISMWLFRILLAYFLADSTDWGVLVVWVAMVADWIVREIFFILRFYSGKWKNKGLI